MAHLYGATIAEVMTGEIVGPDHEVPARPGVTVDDLEVGGVTCRRYASSTGSSSDRPTLVWAHGGAWVAGNLDMPEAHAVGLQAADELGGVVVSVDYRLAPDARHPDARDDLVAVVRALLDEGTPPERLVLGGASAGGNLAAAAAVELRDAGPAQPAALFLTYPATDPIDGPYPDIDRPEEVPETLWLTQPLTAMGFKLYTGEPVVDAAVPNRCRLEGLPPTLVTTAGFDALADQAVRFVELAEAAGVVVVHHHEPHFLHGYLNMVSQLVTADRALTRHLDALRSLLPAGSPDPS